MTARRQSPKRDKVIALLQQGWTDVIEIAKVAKCDTAYVRSFKRAVSINRRQYTKHTGPKPADQRLHYTPVIHTRTRVSPWFHDANGFPTRIIEGIE